MYVRTYTVARGRKRYAALSTSIRRSGRRIVSNAPPVFTAPPRVRRAPHVPPGVVVLGTGRFSPANGGRTALAD